MNSKLRTAEAQDPIIGTWILDPAKSRRTPRPEMTSAIRTYASTPEGIVNTVDVAFSDGTTAYRQFTHKYDGQGIYDVSGDPDETYCFERVDPNTIRFKLTRAGEPVGEGARTLSPDGKVLTVYFKYTDSNGVLHDNLGVYDKQEA